MAKKSNRKQPAQGGGRTSSSEPRIQDFKAFTGMNCELSPFDLANAQEMEDHWNDAGYQTDLIQTYFAVQDNVEICSNGSLETAPSMDLAPFGQINTNLYDYRWTGVAKVIKNRVYMANHASNANVPSDWSPLYWADSLPGNEQTNNQGFATFRQPKCNPRTNSGFSWWNKNSQGVYTAENSVSINNHWNGHGWRFRTKVAASDDKEYVSIGSNVGATKYGPFERRVSDPSLVRWNSRRITAGTIGGDYDLWIWWKPAMVGGYAYFYAVYADPSEYYPADITDICYADDKILACDDTGKAVWIYYIEDEESLPVFERPMTLLDPVSWTSSSTPARDFPFTAQGALTVSTASSTTNPYRVDFCVSFGNIFGPTPVSPAITAYFNKPVAEWNMADNILWNFATTEFFDEDPDDWPYSDPEICDVYYRIDEASSWNFATRLTPMSGAVFQGSFYGYVQDTAAWSVANLTAPTENFTAGPAANSVEYIDGRFYFWDTDRDRIWIGGNPGNLLSTSQYTGGGFVDVEPGRGNRVKVVTKYKTQSGNNIVTALCDNDNTHLEQRFNLVETSVSLSQDQSTRSWQAEQVAGCVGCSARHGGLVAEDGLYTFNRYGIGLTTMTMEYNSQLRTQYVSDPVKPFFVEGWSKHTEYAQMLCLDGILYIIFGFSAEETELDPKNLAQRFIFCYDINKKAWWTLSSPLFMLNVVNIYDVCFCGICHWDGNDQNEEGILAITPGKTYILRRAGGHDPVSKYEPSMFITSLVQSGKYGISQPLQSWFRLSQLQLDFDYLVGNVMITVTTWDRYGRKHRHVKKISTFNHYEGEPGNTTAVWDTYYDHSVFMRIDEDVRCWKLTIGGQNANYRLTHFLAKVYSKSNKVGMHMGFDTKVTYHDNEDYQSYFKEYFDTRFDELDGHIPTGSEATPIIP